MIGYRYTIYALTTDSIMIKWYFDNYNCTSVKTLKEFDRDIKIEFKDYILFTTFSLDSFLIKFRFDVNYDTIKNRISIIIDNLKVNPDSLSTNIFKVPVCYEPFGLDLEQIAYENSLSVDDIINIHCSKPYTIFFMGFLPGFMYLGELDCKINIPRLEKPRPRVEKGSVAIAESFTGIYPMSSPGGWRILGKTPLSIFDVNKNPPSPFQLGDQIQFYKIDETEYLDLLHSDEESLMPSTND